MLLGGAPGQQSQADLANMFDDSQLPMVAVPPLPPPVAPLPILMVPETQFDVPLASQGGVIPETQFLTDLAGDGEHDEDNEGGSDATQVIDESVGSDLDPAADAPGATQPTPSAPYGQQSSAEVASLQGTGNTPGGGTFGLGGATLDFGFALHAACDDNVDMPCLPPPPQRQQLPAAPLLSHHGGPSGHFPQRNVGDAAAFRCQQPELQAVPPRNAPPAAAAGGVTGGGGSTGSRVIIVPDSQPMPGFAARRSSGGSRGRLPSDRASDESQYSVRTQLTDNAGMMYVREETARREDQARKRDAAAAKETAAAEAAAELDDPLLNAAGAGVQRLASAKPAVGSILRVVGPGSLSDGALSVGVLARGGGGGGGGGGLSFLQPSHGALNKTRMALQLSPPSTGPVSKKLKCTAHQQPPPVAGRSPENGGAAAAAAGGGGGHFSAEKKGAHDDDDDDDDTLKDRPTIDVDMVVKPFPGEEETDGSVATALPSSLLGEKDDGLHPLFLQEPSVYRGGGSGGGGGAAAAALIENDDGSPLFEELTDAELDDMIEEAKAREAAAKSDQSPVDKVAAVDQVSCGIKYSSIFILPPGASAAAVAGAGPFSLEMSYTGRHAKLPHPSHVCPKKHKNCRSAAAAAAASAGESWSPVPSGCLMHSAAAAIRSPGRVAAIAGGGGSSTVATSGAVGAGSGKQAQGRAGHHHPSQERRLLSSQSQQQQQQQKGRRGWAGTETQDMATLGSQFVDNSQPSQSQQHSTQLLFGSQMCGPFHAAMAAPPLNPPVADVMMAPAASMAPNEGVIPMAAPSTAPRDLHAAPSTAPRDLHASILPVDHLREDGRFQRPQHHQNNVQQLQLQQQQRKQPVQPEKKKLHPHQIKSGNTAGGGQQQVRAGGAWRTTRKDGDGNNHFDVEPRKAPNAVNAAPLDDTTALHNTIPPTPPAPISVGKMPVQHLVPVISNAGAAAAAVPAGQAVCNFLKPLKRGSAAHGWNDRRKLTKQPKLNFDKR